MLSLKKLLMVLIKVVTNMEDSSRARRASLLHLFSMLMVVSKKRKSEETHLEEQEIFKKLKF